ncbi:uncharacterized protein [Chlorocebus sabaeus]|uniref:uncharacterized protein n=1 Tax=Chlorocebus sabaeus TaxID=60711 RepID=UPI003BF9A098
MNRGPQGHQDQVAYIITWEDLVRNPPSWVKPFFHSPSPSQSTLLAVEAPKNQTSDPPKPVLPDGTQQDLLLFDPPPPPPPHNPLLRPPPYASPSSLTLSPIPPTTPSAPTLSPAPSSVPSSTSPPSPTPPKLTPRMPPPSRPPRSLRASGGRKPAPRPAQPRSQPRSRGLRASGGNPRDAVAASAVARKGEVEKVARGGEERSRAPPPHRRSAPPPTPHLRLRRTEDPDGTPTWQSSLLPFARSTAQSSTGPFLPPTSTIGKLTTPPLPKTLRP